MPKLRLRYLLHALVLFIFAGAMYLLYHKLKAYSLEQIYHSMHQIPIVSILASIGLMIVNYIILVGYDWLALKAIAKKLPLAKVALVSYIGQAFSYNFGALLGGTTVRYRIYSSWGFNITDVVRLVLMLAVTFWVGALGLCGLVFLIFPTDIPEILLAKMPFGDIRILGACLLSITIAYLIACFFVRKPITVFKKEFFFPPIHIATLQALVAGIDLIIAAGCMYVLLPSDLNISFLQFLPNFLIAQVAVVLTHVPGGIGVFELIILHLTQSDQESVVIAAVFCFRLIYFILPLIGAAFVLTIYEMRAHKEFLNSSGQWLSVFSNYIASIAVFLGGIALIFTSILPSITQSHAQSHSLYILHNSVIIANISSFISLLSGVILLFLAYGLERRQCLAWKLTIVVLLCGIMASIFNGLHYLSLVMLILIIIYTISAKRRCYRSSFIWNEKFPIKWLCAIYTVLCAAVALVYFMQKYVLYNEPFFLIQHTQEYIHGIYPALGVIIILASSFIYRYFKLKK